MSVNWPTGSSWSANMSPDIHARNIMLAAISVECHLQNYAVGKSEFYKSYVNIHFCSIRECLRYAQIYLKYGRLYMSYAYFH